MQLAAEKTDTQVVEDFEQKDLGSEFESLASSDYAFSNQGKEIVKLLFHNESAALSFDTTYLFIGGGNELHSILDKKNAFNDPESVVAGKVAVVSAEIPSGKDVIPFAEIVLSQLEQLGLKRITLIGFYDGANVVQALTILSPRLFRRAVLVDPMSRVNPSFTTKVVDRIERHLPVGLPFRASNKEFDSRPFLHRIRCPILILKSPSSGMYRHSESDYIASKIPNCYLISLKEAVLVKNFSNEFLSLIRDFIESPVKRPQKNL